MCAYLPWASDPHWCTSPLGGGVRGVWSRSAIGSTCTLTQILPSLELVDVLCHLLGCLQGLHQLTVLWVWLGRGLEELLQKKRILENPLNWFDEEGLQLPTEGLPRAGGREGMSGGRGGKEEWREEGREGEEGWMEGRNKLNFEHVYNIPGGAHLVCYGNQNLRILQQLQTRIS